jgi:hypothetical protein
MLELRCAKTRHVYLYPKELPTPIQPFSTPFRMTDEEPVPIGTPHSLQTPENPFLSFSITFLLTPFQSQSSFPPLSRHRYPLSTPVPKSSPHTSPAQPQPKTPQKLSRTSPHQSFSQLANTPQYPQQRKGTGAYNYPLCINRQFKGLLHTGTGDEVR